jgi:hypothetical protein
MGNQEFDTIKRTTSAIGLRMGENTSMIASKIRKCGISSFDLLSKEREGERERERGRERESVCVSLCVRVNVE